MKPTLGALGACMAVWLVAAPAALSAQQNASFVLPWGMVRLRAGMHFSHFDSRFAPGGTEPLSAALLQPLTSATFAPVSALETELNRFLTETDAGTGGDEVRAGPDNLLLGTPDIAVSGDVRVVPLALEVGVLPRVQVGVEVPIHRAAVAVGRFGTAGATVGLNPAPDANAAVLATLGPQFRALGAARLLPTDSSALGRELQRRVQALGGGELQLPGAIPDSLAGERDAAFAELFNLLLEQELGLQPLGPELTAWELGDVAVSGRVRVLGNLDHRPFPAEATGVHYRVSVGGSVRLPTGSSSDTVRLFDFRPAAGLRGWSVGAQGDLFVGRRFWVGGTARFATLQEQDVVRRLAPPSLPLATDAEPLRLRWSPGAEIAASLAPRFRLTDAIALGADYALRRRGASTFRLSDSGTGDPTVLSQGAGTTQWLGGSVHYSTLPAHALGGGMPLDVTLSYATAIGGPDGAPVERSLRIEASLYHRFWGR